MTSPRSMFTEAIEDHLALKKQNASLNAEMPLSRFDSGDPLDRFPGGPVRPAPDADQPLPVASTAPATGEDLGLDVDAAFAADPQSPAMTTVIAPDPVGSSLADGDYHRPLEPLNGMTPMLSLVRDVDEEDPHAFDASHALAGATAVATAIEEQPSAPVLRFPGGVGPRSSRLDDIDAELPEAAHELALGDPHADAPTGEQPIIVIDADEPLAPLSPDGPPAHNGSMRQLGGGEKTKRPGFFGLRRGGKRRSSEDVPGSGWFSEKPREFSWDD